MIGGCFLGTVSYLHHVKEPAMEGHWDTEASLEGRFYCIWITFYLCIWDNIITCLQYRLPMAERVGCGTPCLSWSLGVREVVGSRPGRGNIARRVFHPTRKLVRFSLLKLCPSIPNSKKFWNTWSPWGSEVTDHLRIPLLRHPATLKTMPIPANYYINIMPWNL